MESCATEAQAVAEALFGYSRVVSAWAIFTNIQAIGSGKPQHEIHIALEPSSLGIDIQEHDSYIDIFPEVDDLTVHQKIELSPGTVVYIPPATGHRIVNAVVSVLGIPGFKLNNTIFLD